MNKNFVIAAILIAFLSVTIYSFPMNTIEDNSQLAFHSSVCVYKNSELIGPCSHNTMMNTGLNWTIATISQVAVASGNMSIIALGNLTSAETATLTFINNTASNQAIADCGMAPAAGTVAWVGTGNISITKEWTDASCNNLVVNTTALYNQTANGTALTMFAGKNFASSVTLQNGDKLNVTWYVWVT
jgi:hypothetical protein